MIQVQLVTQQAMVPFRVLLLMMLMDKGATQRDMVTLAWQRHLSRRAKARGKQKPRRTPSLLLLAQMSLQMRLSRANQSCSRRRNRRQRKQQQQQQQHQRHRRRRLRSSADSTVSHYIAGQSSSDVTFTVFTGASEGNETSYVGFDTSVLPEEDTAGSDVDRDTHVLDDSFEETVTSGADISTSSTGSSSGDGADIFDLQSDFAYHLSEPRRSSGFTSTRTSSGADSRSTSSMSINEKLNHSERRRVPPSGQRQLHRSVRASSSTGSASTGMLIGDWRGDFRAACAALP